jgi:hypothetical protein
VKIFPKFLVSSGSPLTPRHWLQWNTNLKQISNLTEPNRINSILSQRIALNLFEFFNYFLVFYECSNLRSNFISIKIKSFHSFFTHFFRNAFAYNCCILWLKISYYYFYYKKKLYTVRFKELLLENKLKFRISSSAVHRDELAFNYRFFKRLKFVSSTVLCNDLIFQIHTQILTNCETIHLNVWFKNLLKYHK